MIYLSTADMEPFVTLASEKIYTVYHRLWIENVTDGNAKSALDDTR